MNLDDIRSKIEVLEANHVQIRRLREMSEADFASDPAYFDSTLHRLQTSVRALLDMAAYVTAALGMPSPRTSGDLIRLLEEGGYVRAEDATRYRRMVAFRNRIVHLYNRIDAGIVYQMLHDHADDFDRFRETLIAIIVEHPDSAR